jgi:hypothetical protein
MTETTAPATWDILRNGTRKGLETYWLLMKIMIPVYIVVALLQRTPVLPAMAEFFEPAMQYWHMPGEAALVMVLGHTVNLYAAVAVIATGHWDPMSVTIAGVILGVSHNHIMESAILKKMNAPIMFLVPMRIAMGWILGWVVARLIGS